MDACQRHMYRAALRAGALSAVPGLDELEQSIIDGDIVVKSAYDSDMDQAAIDALKDSVKVGR